jgi:ABC-2 type transport system permease protein
MRDERNFKELNEMENDTIHRILAISRRELSIFAHRPLFLFTMIIAPVVLVIFFTTLMGSGLPTSLPTGIVDEDNTHVTRIVERIVDSFEETNIVAHYNNVNEAREAMQRGEIYAFLYLPRRTTVKALTSRQPRLSFYTNEAYLVPGTLLMKDLTTGSVMSGLGLTRETLYAHGDNERTALGKIRGIVTENHPLNNPTLNYSVYLTNIILPGILILLILLSTTYTIGLEWKRNTQKHWFEMANCSVTTAITGKLLPQTILFCIIFIFYDVYMFKFLQYPCNCGIAKMMALGILTVLASQSFGIFLFGLFSGFLRIAMALSCLWGILSFSLAGFTYPTTAMNPALAALAYLFPLRHYYLIYVNQALDNFSLAYVWQSVAALFIFILLPFTVLHRYHIAFDKYKYIP